MYYIVSMKRKPRLVWDKWNKEHIKKHSVLATEVEEVFASKKITRLSYKNRKLMIGKTLNGRLLTIVISKEKQTDPYVVSARDASQKERGCYYEQTKTYKII